MIQCDNEKKNGGDAGEDIVEMSALTVSTFNVRTEKKDGDYADFIDSLKVNGKVEALYETGATKAALERDLVRPDQYTDKWVQCRFANGTSARYPIAKVEIEGELFKGMVEVMVIPDLLMEMIVTPKQYARPMKAKKVLTQDSSTNTISEEELETVQAEDAQKYERPMINEEISDDDEEDEVHDVEIATYELRNKIGDTRQLGITPLKWHVLTEWKLTPSEVLEMQLEDPTLEKYWKMARGETGTKESGKDHVRFVIKKGMLCRKFKEELKDGVRLQLMVPEKLRIRVLHMAHESLMSAHQGVKKMQEKISEIFYWPSMFNDVKRHFSNCDIRPGGLDRQGLTKAPLGHLPL